MATEQPGYLTTYMVLQSWWFILNIFDQNYDSYNEVSGAAYVWLNVSNMDVSYGALSNMAVTDRCFMSLIDWSPELSTLF